MAVDTSSMTSEQKKNLMINYIPRDVSESELRELFTQHGPISNLHVVKNKQTQESAGYGFITYCEEESAGRAIAMLNGAPLKDKRLRVAYSVPKEAQVSKVNTDEANVYVANMPKQFRDDKMRELFAQFGNIIQLKILTEAGTDISRGAGFVKYDSSKAAAQAILAMDGVTPAGGSVPLVVKIADGKKKNKDAGNSTLSGLVLNQTSNGAIRVNSESSRFNPYSKSPSQPPMQQQQPMMHPGAYPPAASFGHLPGYPQSMMQPSSQPTHPAPSMPSMSHQPHPYMQQQQPMQQQPPPQHTHQPSPTFQGTAMQNPATAQDKASYCLYIGNLPETSCKNCLLYQLFSPFGAIVSVKPMQNKVPDNNSDHWFAFVNMKEYGQAVSSIQSLNNSTLNGRTLKVDFKTDKKR